MFDRTGHAVGRQWQTRVENLVSSPDIWGRGGDTIKTSAQTDAPHLKVTGEIRPMSAYAVTLCRWNRVPSKRSNRIMSWSRLKLRPLFPTKGMSWKHNGRLFFLPNSARFHTHWPSFMNRTDGRKLRSNFSARLEFIYVEVSARFTQISRQL